MAPTVRRRGSCAGTQNKSAAAAPTTSAFARAPIDRRILAASCQSRGVRSVYPELPEIVSVVDDDGSLIGGEAGRAVRATLRNRVIVFRVDETRSRLRSEIRARVGLKVCGPPLSILLIQRVTAARAERGTERRPGEQLRARSSRRIDDIDVTDCATRHHLSHIRGFVRRERDALVLGELHRLVRIIGQPNRGIGADAPCSERRSHAILSGLHLLLMKLAEILPVPDLDSRRRRLFGCARLRRLPGFSSRNAEEEHLAIVRPLRRAVSGDAQFARERVVAGEIVGRLRRRIGGVGPCENHEARIDECAIRPATKNGQSVALRSPRQASVLIGRRVERANGAGFYVEQLHAIAGLTVDVDRHREHRSVVAPRRFVDVAEGELGAVVEIANDQVRASPASRRVPAKGDV